jgi:hypothetical protein
VILILELNKSILIIDNASLETYSSIVIVADKADSGKRKIHDEVSNFIIHKVILIAHHCDKKLRKHAFQNML